MRIPISPALFYSLVMILLMTGCFSMPAPPKEQLPYYTSADFTPYWLNAKDAETLHRIPPFSFTNQEGQTITEKTFASKIIVVNFFFTSCPGICKKLTKNLFAVQAAFKNDDNVLLLSHSVTPERDNVPILHTYAAANGIIAGKWHLVTGLKTAIYSIARHAYFADEDLGIQQDSSSFLHTENILLIDKQYHIRGVYKGTLPAEIDNLIADIKKLETAK